MANIEVGSAYVSIYPNTSKLSGEISKSLSKINYTSIGNKAGGLFSGGISSKLALVGTALTGIPFASIGRTGGESFGSSFSGVAATMAVTVGNLLSNTISGAVNTAMSGISSGIRRSDILRNFPRVMDSLGYSAEDASGAVQEMMDHLLGLPTATQDMALWVQGLTAATNDMEKGTKLGLALNDMFLAGGNSAAEAAMGMEVFTRMLGSGSYNAMRWQSISAKIPGQLKQVAERLLGAGNNAQTLGEALSQGTVSFDDLTAAIMDMDKNSTDAFTNFEEQARAATGGIGTAITNMGTRIGAGWQYVIDLFGNDNVASVITAYGNGIRDSIKAVGDAIDIYLDPEDVQVFAEGIKQGFANGIEGFRTFVHSPYWATIKNTFTTLLEAAKSFGDGLATALGEGYVGEKLSHLGELFINVGRQFRDFIKGIDFTAVGETIGNAVNTIAETFDKLGNLWADNFLNNIDLSAAQTAFENIREALHGVWEWAQPVLEAWAQMAGSNLASIFNIISDAITSFIEAVQGTGEYFWQTADGAEGLGTPLQVLQENFIYLCDVIGRFLEAIRPVGEIVGVALAAVFNTIIVVINNVVATIATFIEGLMTLPATWEAVKQAAVSVWESIKAFFISLFINIVTNILRKVNEIVHGLQNAWNTIKTTVTTVWNAIKTTIETVWNAIKTTVSNVVNAIKDFISTAWENIKNTVSNAVDAVAKTVTSVFETVKSTVTNVWDNIKETIGGVVDGIKTKVSDVFESVKDTVGNVFTSISDTASDIWEGIKETIGGAIEGARDIVEGAIETIKGLFNFDWSLPNLALPHIVVGGYIDVPVLGTIPDPSQIWVEWYAKGGFVDGATLIGAGEKGAEMILPRRGGLMNEFADTVTAKVDDTADGELVIAWLSRNLPSIIENYTPTTSSKDFQRQVRSAAWSV